MKDGSNLLQVILANISICRNLGLILNLHPGLFNSKGHALCATQHILKQHVGGQSNFTASAHTTLPRISTKYMHDWVCLSMWVYMYVLELERWPWPRWFCVLVVFARLSWDPWQQGWQHSPVLISTHCVQHHRYFCGAVQGQNLHLSPHLSYSSYPCLPVG